MRMSKTEETPIDFILTAPLEKDGPFATFIATPGSDEALGTRRAVKVAGTLDGHGFSATLMPSGQGPHILPIRAALATLIGKSEAGERVAIHLTSRLR
jgi:hypothetical protein